MFNESITCAYLYIITKYGYPPPAEDTERHLDEMKALGYRSVELEGIRAEHLRVVHARRSSIRARLDALELKVPYFCAVLPGLSSPEPEERKANLELFKLGCETATDLGALGILDNAPLPPYQFPDDIPVVRHYDEDVLFAASFPKDLEWGRYWTDLAATYGEACDIADAYGLTFQVHPALGVLASTADGFLLFHDAVGRNNLRFTFDTANQFVMKENLALALRRLAPYVDYIHISDNRGVHVEHLAIGEGAIRWDVFFEALAQVGFDGHVGVDIGGAESDVADLDRSYKEAGHWLTERLVT